MEAKLLSSTDQLQLYCQAYFAQTLRRAFRESVLKREHVIKMSVVYNVSNLETRKDLAVLSRLTVINSKNQSNICVKEGQKKRADMQ